MRLAGVVGFWVLLSLPLHADVIHLLNGGRLTGAIIDADKFEVTLELSSGTSSVSIPRKDIKEIDYTHEAPIEVWNGMWPRYAGMTDPEVLCFLAHWTESNGLKRQTTMLKDRLKALAPDHDYEHKGERATELQTKEKTVAVEEVGKTELIEEEPEEEEPKKKKRKPRPKKITVAPTWVPPLARIDGSGAIYYPPRTLAPGPTNLPSTDAIDIPYWGVPPKGLSYRGNKDDLKRLKGEFSSEGLLRAVQTWRIVERAIDVLLLPPNAGNTRQWRLIYALGPKKDALEAIEQIRSGELQQKGD